ncbi:hypothetical protein N0V88_001369 [Collariella sp. IMI 366227]|nr:hypothetical protein N0V88_001369 [Collariella sp. IMI 366227]
MDGVAGILVGILSFLLGIMAGCGADLLINVLLTIWLWFPGVIHAFYLLFVYYDRRDKYRTGRIPLTRAPFVYSDKVQSGGMAYGRI